MSGTTSDGFPHGAWALSFSNVWQQKPLLLLCPKATSRRGPGAGLGAIFRIYKRVQLSILPVLAFFKLLAFRLGTPRQSTRLT